jgi:hypothetical protein
MKVEIITIAGAISAQKVNQAVVSLRALSGVEDVSFLDSPARLYARINEDATARAELITVLAGAGVVVAEEKRPHGEGSCCGGCGGA